MGDEIKTEGNPKAETLAIKRGNVTITSTQRTPVVYTALEQVVWQTGQAQIGQAQISGVGKDRRTALDALEESYGKLKEVLAVAE
jgi:hypothetical protein